MTIIRNTNMSVSTAKRFRSSMLLLKSTTWDRPTILNTVLDKLSTVTLEDKQARDILNTINKQYRSGSKYTTLHAEVDRILSQR